MPGQMHRFGARLLDIGAVEDGGNRGWAINQPNKPPPRVPFISAQELHAMCYARPMLRKSPSAISMQAKQTRVNGQALPDRPWTMSSASSCSRLGLEDSRPHSRNSLAIQDTRSDRPFSQSFSRNSLALQDNRSPRPVSRNALQDNRSPRPPSRNSLALQDNRSPRPVSRNSLALQDSLPASRNSFAMQDMRFDRQPSRNSLAIQDNRDLVAVVERNLSELDLEPRSRRTMSSKELVQARSRASSRDSRRRSPGSSRSSSKSSVHNSRPSSRKGSKTRNFSKASNASHASRSTEAEREVKEKTERDRKLSSGAALGLDLAIFEHRKSRSEKEQTPREQSRRVSSVSEFSASSKKSTLRSEGGEETPRAVPKAKPETPAATFRELMKAKAREAYQKRRKLTSTNLEPDLKDPVFLPAQHLLPKSVSALDVPTAIDFFDHYDKVRAHGNSGLLDRKALAEMLYAIGQGKDAMSTEWSDAIFKELDFQHCGQLDKEQFLGWAFSCRNNYHSDVRRRFHAVVDDEQLHELVRQGMASGSGLAKDVLVTKEDLWFLVETCYVQLSRVANDQLHAYLANGSESVSAQQLLNWLYPGRELRELQAKFEALRQQMPDLEEPEFDLPTAEGFQRPKRPLWEPSLKQPVVLKFTIASAFRGKIKYLQENLGAFSELQLKIHVVLDETLRNSCSRVVVELGRGMVIWDCGTMTPYREDPFETKASAWAWLKEYIMNFAPDAISASQVAYYKQQRRQLKRQKAAAKAGRDRVQSDSGKGSVENPDSPAG